MEHTFLTKAQKLELIDIQRDESFRLSEANPIIISVALYHELQHSGKLDPRSSVDDDLKGALHKVNWNGAELSSVRAFWEQRDETSMQVTTACSGADLMS